MYPEYTYLRYMKKQLILLLFALIYLYPVAAQTQPGQLSVSANLSYGTDIKTMGIGLRAQYTLKENLRASAEYKYYLDRRNWSAWEFNADAHYMFRVKNYAYLYPIAGLKYLRRTYDLGRAGIPGFNIKDSHNRLGLNLGFGGQLAITENIYLQLELREELVKDFTQFVPLIGFMLQF